MLLLLLLVYAGTPQVLAAVLDVLLVFVHAEPLQALAAVLDDLLRLT